MCCSFALVSILLIETVSLLMLNFCLLELYFSSKWLMCEVWRRGGIIIW